MPDPSSEDREVALLRESFRIQLADLRVLLDERHSAQAKAVEAAMVAADKAVGAALLAAEKAVNKAEAAAERRFESVNEFRAQLADQQRTFLPRQEYDVQHAALNDKLDTATANLLARIEALSKQINDTLLGVGVNRADELARRGTLSETRIQANWTMGQMVAIGASLLAAAVAVVALLR